MAKLAAGFLLNIGLDPLPVVLLVAHLVAIGTDRNQLLELMNFFRKREYSFRDAEPHLNPAGVERLNEKIVNACGSGEIVVFRANVQGSEENEICVRRFRARSHLAAKLQPIHAGHQPIAYGNSHRIAIERFPRFGSSARHHNFVARALESQLQDV